jgi:hypothetical protein
MEGPEDLSIDELNDLFELVRAPVQEAIIQHVN